MLATQLDAIAGLPRQARGSRLCAHIIALQSGLSYVI